MRTRHEFSVPAAISVLLISLPLHDARAQQLSTAERAAVDSVAMSVLASTGAPSASVAIVRGGQIVYEHAYGDGRLNPRTSAASSMRYAIGSVSKQFTATALLLLAERGKLSIDDKVANWFPQLTRANDISIRQLLSMTSGYQDFWPQDYVFTDMQKPATADEIMRRWASKPLDFEPGTRWQYSNTNYVIAGAIVERVSGIPFMDFLRQNIFAPLGMTSVADFNAAPLTTSDAGAYLRNAVGPLRPAPKEAQGWLFGAGQLAMTAHDLATWDIAVIKRSVLRTSSYNEQQRDMLLENGVSSRYGLGVSVGTGVGGRRRISHTGAVSGYTTSNEVYPDDSAAVVVFTNIYPGAAGAPTQISGRVATILFAKVDTAAATARDLARRMYGGLMKGTIDRSLLTSELSDYFTPQVLSDYASSLTALGTPSEFAPTGESLRGGMTIRTYRIRAGRMMLTLVTMTLPDGTIDQYLVERAG